MPGATPHNVTARVPRCRALVLATLLPLAATACSSGSDAGNAGATTAPGATGGSVLATAPPKNDGCFTLPPGQVYTAEQAVVALKTASVCPSFMTVKAGVTVRFRNDDTTPQTVRVSRGNAPNTAQLLAEEQIAPGSTWSFRFGDPGAYLYTTDVLRTFLGVIEVDAAP